MRQPRGSYTYSAPRSKTLLKIHRWWQYLVARHLDPAGHGLVRWRDLGRRS
jgi:hypothetical protein